MFSFTGDNVLDAFCGTGDYDGRRAQARAQLGLFAPGGRSTPANFSHAFSVPGRASIGTGRHHLGMHQRRGAVGIPPAGPPDQGFTVPLQIASGSCEWGPV